MKGKIAVLAGACVLIPTLALADYCRDCGDHSHHARKHAAHHDWKAHKHWQKHSRKQERKQARKHRRDARHSYTELARVIDVEPVYRYYTQTTEHNSCLRREVTSSAYNSWTPAILGAVIGGTVGHKIGDSYGDADVAAVAGGVLGATLGRDVARHNRESRALHVSGPCRPEKPERVRREPLEYVVTYRYNGQVYRTHMDHHPGDWVELDVKLKPV